MYPPKPHTNTDFELTRLVMDTFPLANLVSVHENIPLATPIPLLYDLFGEDLLWGHLDRNNPQAAHFLEGHHSVLAIFKGPNTYLSPESLTAMTLPTWNYIEVQVRGTLTPVTLADELLELLIRTTERFEQTNQTSFKLDKSHKQMNRLLDYILGFKIEVESVENRFKLSQDKPLEDQQTAQEILLAHTPEKNYFQDSVTSIHGNISTK